MSCPFAYPVACMFYYVLLEVVSQSLKPVKLRANGRNNSQQCWELKMKRWSSQWTQFMQLRKEAWKKFRTSTGFEPVTSRLPVRCSTKWAMKPLTLEEGQLWVHMFPWKKWVLMIYEINHIWTAEMKWKWRNDRRSEPNLCNCINSGLQRGQATCKQLRSNYGRNNSQQCWELLVVGQNRCVRLHRA